MDTGRGLDDRAAKTIYISSDKLCLERDRLLIHAAEAMNWPVREYCRVPIFVLGQKYYARGRYPAKRPYQITYELWPWPANLHEHSSESVTYDEVYVRERNRTARHEKGRDLLDPLLFLSYPVLGLFWSKFKNKFLRPSGFDPQATSALSLVLTVTLSFFQAVQLQNGLGGIATWIFDDLNFRLWDSIFLAVLIVDSAFRLPQCLKAGRQEYWGLGEWLLLGFSSRPQRSAVVSQDKRVSAGSAGVRQ